MKGGVVLFLAFLWSVVHSAAAGLTFLNQGPDYVTVERGDDTYSDAISPTSSFPFGFAYSFETTIYVSTNGYFSIGTTPPSASLSKFSSSRSYSVVAPFAADIDTTHTGSVQYSTFTAGHPNIDFVNNYIRSDLRGSFRGSWMLLAEWNDVPLLSGSTLSTNTFQGVIITDGSTSYAVFLYFCPYMVWSGNAVIGWQASSAHYRNHPLSGSSNAREAACWLDENSYTTVIFKLSSVSSCTTFMYFGCFNGSCILFPERCDGHSDCPDASDEVFCSYGLCADQFECDNGQCKSKSSVCDGADDCGDNSDEEGCVNTGLAVGLSVAGLLFLFLFVDIPVCVVCLVCYTSQRRRGRPSVKARVVATTPPAAGTTIATTAQIISAGQPHLYLQTRAYPPPTQNLPAGKSAQQ